MLQACGSGGEKQVGGDLNVSWLDPIGSGWNAPTLTSYDTARFSVDISGGQAPYALTWYFGGACETQFSNLNEPGQANVNVLFVPLAATTNFTAMLVVSDAAGNAANSTLQFTVIEPQVDCFVSINSLTYSDGLIRVSGSDADGGALTFTAQLDSGEVIITGPFNETATSAEFVVKPRDVLAGGNFTVTVSATCEPGFESASDSVSGSFDAFPLADDTLYAIATQTQAAVGEPVRIVVATGDTASSFQYLNSCILTWQVGGSYVGQSFDIGAPDDVPEQAVPIDGVWGDMGATSFLLNLFPIETMPIGNGLLGTGFYVTPLGGSDITANGLLFNFQVEFAEPGTYTIGILDNPESVVSRTYYQDSAAEEDHFWSDISNNHDYNTIVVE